jgi:small subunit ribosomal protein S8
MLTRIRNALGADLDVVEMPYSRLKGDVVGVMKREGFLTDYVVEGGRKKVLRVYLKYTEAREPVIKGIQRESRPGLRRYVQADSVPRVLGGLGVGILSTSSGVMTDKDAREQHVGGELLCSLW